MLFGRILSRNGFLIFQLLAWLCITGKIVNVFFPSGNSRLLKDAVTFFVFVLLVSACHETGIIKIPGFQAYDADFEDQCDILNKLIGKLKDHLTQIDDVYLKIENQLAFIENYYESEIKDLSKITITKIEDLSTIIKYHKTTIDDLFSEVKYHIIEIKDLVTMSRYHTTKMADILFVAGIDFTVQAEELIGMITGIEEDEVKIIYKRQSTLERRIENFGSLFIEYIKEEMLIQADDTKTENNRCEK